MGIQVVESSLEPPRSSFAQQQQQQYGPWNYHDVRSSSRRYGWGEGAAAALISNAFSEKKRFARAAEGGSSKGSKGSSKTAAACLPLPAPVVEQVQEEQPGTSSARSTEEVLLTAPVSAPVSSSASASVPPPTATATTSPWPSFTILIPAPSTSPILTFPLAPIIPPHLSHVKVEVLTRPKSLKRPRPPTDVDGHNTAPLPCKKRRLRLHFVTSRLSRPFSLPATHILNWESILKGDKRLRSIAAAANRRMAMAGWGFGGVGGQNGGITMAMGGESGSGNGNAASSWLRKMAVMNRFRMRIMGEGLVRAQLAQQAAQTQIQGAVPGLGGQGGHHDAGKNEGGGGVDTGGVPMQRTAQEHHGHGPGTSPRPPLPWCSQVGGQQLPAPVITGFPPPVIYTTTTSTSSGPSASASASTPQRLHPVPSPDLRPIDDQEDQDFDDEDVAFPTSAHESRYEGEEEGEGHEVYADFGVLFGGGEDDLDEEGHTMSGEMSGEQQQEFLGPMDDWDGVSCGGGGLRRSRHRW